MDREYRKKWWVAEMKGKTDLALALLGLWGLAALFPVEIYAFRPGVPIVAAYEEDAPQIVHARDNGLPEPVYGVSFYRDIFMNFEGSFTVVVREVATNAVACTSPTIGPFTYRPETELPFIEVKKGELVARYPNISLDWWAPTCGGGSGKYLPGVLYYAETCWRVRPFSFLPGQTVCRDSLPFEGV